MGSPGYQELLLWFSSGGLPKCFSLTLDSSGESPFKVLDLSGNVYEWTGTIFAERDNLTYKNITSYPYKSDDGREDLRKGDNFLLVLRGGSFYDPSMVVRCASRDGIGPNSTFYLKKGFRIVVSPMLLS